MSDVVVPPPDQTAWWDVDAVTAAALDILRLTATDVDADRVRSLVPVVGTDINNRLDAAGVLWPEAIVPDPVNQALIYGVVEAYRAKDSPPANGDDFTLVSGYLPVDPLRSVWPMLSRYRQRFGVG